MSHVRWDLSISIIPAVKEICQVPILVDGSHGTGRRDLVEPMTLAGIAAGADGCLIEVHPNPQKSLSDADQAVTKEKFKQIMNKVIKLREVIY
jgi:3-deoxy-7-phosphoheptulonate synthase